MTLGQRLRDLRVHHDPYIKQRDLARRLGVPWYNWNHIEADRERPTRDLIARVTPMIGGDLGELLRLLEEWQEAPPPDLSGNVCREGLVTSVRDPLSVLADILELGGASHKAVKTAGGGQVCGQCGHRWPCERQSTVTRQELVWALREARS